jgi:hypothetical protein
MDRAEAVNWWRKAAAQEFAPAQFSLGTAYEEGSVANDIKPDFDQAADWYRKSAEQGYAPAKKALASLAQKPRPSDHVQTSPVQVKLDPNDVVAQVLNYSTFGNDAGSDGVGWYKVASTKCVYKINYPIGLFPASERSIDLDDFDPKNITFQQHYHPADSVTLNQLGFDKSTSTEHLDTVIASSSGYLTLERLQRVGD